MWAQVRGKNPSRCSMTSFASWIFGKCFSGTRIVDPNARLTFTVQLKVNVYFVSARGLCVVCCVVCFSSLSLPSSQRPRRSTARALRHSRHRMDCLVFRAQFNRLNDWNDWLWGGCSSNGVSSTAFVIAECIAPQQMWSKRCLISSFR